MTERFRPASPGEPDFIEDPRRSKFLMQDVSIGLMMIGIILISVGIWQPINQYFILQQNQPPPLPQDVMDMENNSTLPGFPPSLADNPLPVLEQSAFANETRQEGGSVVIVTPEPITTTGVSILAGSPSLSESSSLMPEVPATNSGALATEAAATPTTIAPDIATIPIQTIPLLAANITQNEALRDTPSQGETEAVTTRVPIASLSQLTGFDGTARSRQVRQSASTLVAALPPIPFSIATPLPSPTPLPPPTATPLSTTRPLVPPNRIVAPDIGLDSEVVETGWSQREINGQLVSVWDVAEYAAGWHKNSAVPGQTGNIVLAGHHNILGEVFRYTVDLEPGNLITLYADDQSYPYRVEEKFIVKDKGEPPEVRQANARWIGSFADERLTLITCWPYNNNTHRVIVIAKPYQAKAAVSDATDDG